jgi:hypothetical protein
MTKLSQLPILNQSEFHYLIDTDEYDSSLLDISKELILNNIPFSHHISEDVNLSYLIINMS